MILTPYYIYKGETRRKSCISILALMAAILAVMMLGSCSTTSSLAPGDQLVTGLKPIADANEESGSHSIPLCPLDLQCLQRQRECLGSLAQRHLRQSARTDE